MIPRIIHYCWFGRGEMPQLAKECIPSWHKYMPDWEYKLWNEEAIVRFAQTSDFEASILGQNAIRQNSNTIDPLPETGVRGPKSKNFEDVLKSMSVYAWEAYQAKKYAFVSDYIRLWALENFGGVYLDTDVECFRSFEPLLKNNAFAGFEGSKYLPIGTCVLASEPHGEWVTEQLKNYENRHFVKDDGSLDMTTNVQFITSKMGENGFNQNGKEQDYKDLHIFPVDYFSPRHTTGEYVRTENTYCEHKGLGSWADTNGGWKSVLRKVIGQKNMTNLIKLKRKIIG